MNEKNVIPWKIKDFSCQKHVFFVFCSKQLGASEFGA